MIFTRSLFYIFLLSLGSGLFISCQKKIDRVILVPDNKDRFLKKELSFSERVDSLLRESEAFRNAFIGISVYDPQKRDTVYELNSHKLFTPASNMKILTLGVALEYLETQLSSLSYDYFGDTLIFCGNGYPLFLNPFIEDNQSAYDLLNAHRGKIIYNAPHMSDGPYGPGWSWDDYKYLYQTEKSPYPIFGNSIWVYKANQHSTIRTVPRYFNDFVRSSSDSSKFYIERDLHSNRISVMLDKSDRLVNSSFPMVQSDSLIVRLLSDTLHRKVHFEKNVKREFHKDVKGFSRDSLLHRMMYDSNNFLAEQFLLQSSYHLSDTLSSKWIIKKSLDEIYDGFSDPIRWVDGSGLSRYNLNSPSNFIYALQKIKSNLGEDIGYFFPEGNKKSLSKPLRFIHAKSGSLSNNYCLSGYITTQKGDRLIFSFMANHFEGSNKRIKKVFTELLEMIYKQYAL